MVVDVKQRRVQAKLQTHHAIDPTAAAAAGISDWDGDSVHVWVSGAATIQKCRS